MKEQSNPIEQPPYKWFWAEYVTFDDYGYVQERGTCAVTDHDLDNQDETVSLHVIAGPYDSQEAAMLAHANE